MSAATQSEATRPQAAPARAPLFHRVVTTSPRALVIMGEDALQAKMQAQQLNVMFPYTEFAVEATDEVFDLPDAHHLIQDCAHSVEFKATIERAVQAIRAGDAT